MPFCKLPNDRYVNTDAIVYLRPADSGFGGYNVCFITGVELTIAEPEAMHLMSNVELDESYVKTEEDNEPDIVEKPAQKSFEPIHKISTNPRTQIAILLRDTLYQASIGQIASLTDIPEEGVKNTLHLLIQERIVYVLTEQNPWLYIHAANTPAWMKEQANSSPGLLIANVAPSSEQSLVESSDLTEGPNHSY